MAAEIAEIGIIGAGPVGSLLAINLARSGSSVRVFERRPDMRVESVAGGRSINLALSTRGLHALEQIGLKQRILSRSIPMRGRMIHPLKGDLAFQAYGKDESECIYSISRAELNRVLMNEAESGGRVRIAFNQKAVGADFSRNEVHFVDERTGESSSERARAFFGADGSASAIRRAMTELNGYPCTETALDYGYKELVIPARSDGTFALEKNALHIWPRGNFMLIALPNFDGSFTGTLFLPFKGDASFANLNAPSRVADFFQTYFPDAAPLIADLGAQFSDHPTGQMTTIKASRWNVEDRFLLLGDAAHGIVPFFGQGMNCGFEDCVILSESLASEPDWKKAFSEFSRRRRLDSDAIADMAVENFVEMRDKVGDRAFLLAKEVEKILLREFPGRFVSRYSLVTFSRVPYRLARDAGLLADEILLELSTGLTSANAVDLARASRLIDSKLAAFMKGTQWI